MAEKPVLLDSATPPLNSCANRAIRRAARRMGQIYDDAFVSVGLRATQYSLLSQIVRSQGPTMRVLAREMVMDLSALGHTLKPLVRDGFVVLTVDPNDRRSKRVNLTEAGLRKYEEAYLISKVVGEAFDTTFGIEEAVQVRAAMDRIASDEFLLLINAKLGF
ncbi:MarR family winged helix-turn-helix transcriptional regulator [Pseudomonas sp. NA-150]|uniref:MarR family winged helix-turn-helix transcriptional regulator n=1 Tax=Pseudomonas sp. NA-150 TaxID=3367525 RepID=UPI0037C7A01F